MSCVIDKNKNLTKTLTKTCPKCGQERGFANTFELKGLSPFLQELDKFVNDEREQDGSLDATITN